MSQLVTLFLISVICATVAECQVGLLPVPGGLSKRRRVKPGDEIMTIAKDLKEETEKMTGKTYPKFVPKSYKTQVVSGYMYYVKVRVGRGKDKFIHIKIHHQPWIRGPQLADVKEDQTNESPIESF
ncbi:cystatin-A-like [Styela clava]